MHAGSRFLLLYFILTSTGNLRKQMLNTPKPWEFKK